MKKILLTGAAGRIGSSFRQYVEQQASDRYALRLVDRNLDALGDPGPHEAHDVNVADLDACRQICQGIHTVVHLAADPSPRADFYESLLDNNIKGMYNIFRAAKDAGCQRVVYASSVQAVDGYPMDVQVRTDMPVRPLNMYGAAKAFGEATAHCFAYSEGLSCIAIRVGAYQGNRQQWDENERDARTLCTFVSARDLNHLIERCIEAPNVQYAVVQAVSDNRFKRMDLTSTRASVGYTPQDDAFELFHTGLTNHERWYQEHGRTARTESQ